MPPLACAVFGTLFLGAQPELALLLRAQPGIVVGHAIVNEIRKLDVRVLYATLLTVNTHPVGESNVSCFISVWSLHTL